MLRIAKEQDHPTVVEMSRAFFKDTQYGSLEIDEAGHNTTVSSFLNPEDRDKICLLFEADGKPVGCIAGQVTPIPFLNRKVASECIWWVHPDYRGTLAGVELLAAFEYWAGLQGANFMQMMCMPDTTGKLLDRFYTRRGYRLTELTYTKEL